MFHVLLLIRPAGYVGRFILQKIVVNYHYVSIYIFYVLQFILYYDCEWVCFLPANKTVVMFDIIIFTTTTLLWPPLYNNNII